MKAERKQISLMVSSSLTSASNQPVQSLVLSFHRSVIIWRPAVISRTMTIMNSRKVIRGQPVIVGQMETHQMTAAYEPPGHNVAAYQ